jgi:hypothetical protein
VSSYDFEADKDITLFVKATQPGTYAMVKEPPKSQEPPKGQEPPAKKDD